MSSWASTARPCTRGKFRTMIPARRLHGTDLMSRVGLAPTLLAFSTIRRNGSASGRSCVVKSVTNWCATRISADRTTPRLLTACGSPGAADPVSAPDARAGIAIGVATRRLYAAICTRERRVEVLFCPICRAPGAVAEAPCSGVWPLEWWGGLIAVPAEDSQYPDKRQKTYSNSTSSALYGTITGACAHGHAQGLGCGVCPMEQTSDPDR